MKLSTLNNKKSLKIVTLLISSLIIATVSAASYSELFMYGNSITIGTASVKFTTGANTTQLGGADAINAAGTIVTFDQIQIAPGDVATYDEAVNVTNSAGASKTITISVESISGDFSTNFDYLNITRIAGDGSTKGTSIEIVSTGSNVTTTDGQTMTAGEIWAIRWELKAKPDATIGESFTIALKVTVA
ncbi:hypothetical protein G4O51_08375 [Candidatus Bathyarchaeota archaeon A05DMB-2]|jgi:hypothetical protein|nr:hypothetical protein [Candidatus Bathyarchaeota archaeon A05DMB-2]